MRLPFCRCLGVAEAPPRPDREPASRGLSCVALLFGQAVPGRGGACPPSQALPVALDEEQLNGSHQILIVASSLDASTERIVSYLNRVNLAISVIFFRVFRDGENQYLSRAWLIDPVETEGKAISSRGGQKDAWNGEYYVSFGHGDVRDWADAVKFSFICGGGSGPWYSKMLFLLEPGDRIWVNVPKPRVCRSRPSCWVCCSRK